MKGLASGALPGGGWVTLPGDLAWVEEAVRTLGGFLPRRDGADPGFELRLVCFEALANAVRHGCGNDPARTVRAELRAADGVATLTVSDPGPGFDWRAALARRPADADTGGRGLWILRRYGDGVRFNEAGNQITITKRIEPGADGTRRHPGERS